MFASIPVQKRWPMTNGRRLHPNCDDSGRIRTKNQSARQRHTARPQSIAPHLHCREADRRTRTTDATDDERPGEHRLQESQHHDEHDPARRQKHPCQQANRHGAGCDGAHRC